MVLLVEVRDTPTLPSLVTFVVATVLIGSLILLIALPVLILAWRRGRFLTFRRFLISGGLVILASAITVTSSTKVRAQCVSVGNASYNCLDYGGAGMLLLMIGGFGAAALVRAASLFRD